MESKKGVNRSIRRRGYGARDKEELINAIKQLHDQGYSQVEIKPQI